MNFGNLHLLADGKTGAKQTSSSAEEADKPIADKADKAEDPDIGTNQVKE